MAVIVVLAAVVGIGAYFVIPRDSGIQPVRPSRSTVAEFNGAGDTTTNVFTVREGWQIQWETTGKRFAFAIIGDRDFGTVIDRRKPGTGVTSPVGGGTFRLHITANGPWSVQIIQA